MNSYIFVIDHDFIGFISDKTYDLPIGFRDRDDAEEFAKELKLDYVILDKPEVAY